MKREDLRKIEGLSKEQIDAIMNLHQSDVNEWNSRSKAQSDDIKAKDDKINELTAKVKEFDGVDVKQLQQSISDWESKYHKDLAAKDKEYAKKMYFDKIPFASELAKNAAMVQFDSKDFKFEDGKFLGADDFIDSLKQSAPVAYKKQDPKPSLNTGWEMGNNSSAGEDDELTRRFKELNPDIKI